MHDPDLNASPFNAIPPVIVGLVVAIAAIELGFQLGASGLIGGPQAVGWRLAAIESYGFFDPLFDYMRLEWVWPLQHVARFVTYAFVHAEAVHAIFAAVLLLAMGKFVAERFASWAVLVVVFGSAIVGALAYGLILDTNVPLIGFYPGVYGLIGAYTFTLLLFYEATGQNRLQAFQLIAFLLGLQLLFGALFGGGLDWVADFAGFVTGFALSFAVAPGGSWRISRLLDRTRDR